MLTVAEVSLRNWLPSAADDADVARLPPLAGLDAVTIAQAIHLLDRSPLFQTLAERMSPRAGSRSSRTGVRSGSGT